MKSANHLFAASGRRLSAPKGVVLGLTLTSLLSGGLTLALSSGASAASMNWMGGEISQAAQNQTIRSRRLPRAIALSVLQDAARRSGQPINSIRIIQATPKTFGNPCAFNFGEVCTYEYNPVQGWEVVVRVRGQAWTYHVDRTASQVVLDPKISGGNTSELPAAVRTAVLSDAVRRSGLPINSLRIIEATSKTFSSLCELTFGGPCTAEYNPVPGWEVTVQVGQRSWLYRSDRTGSRIALNPTIAANPGNIPGAYIDAVIMDAVRRANVSPASLRILETKAMTFGNPCMFNFGEVCTREYRPIEGYEVLVQVRGQNWRYHVDKTGSQVVLDPRIAGNTSVLPSAIESAVLQNAIAWTQNRAVKIVEAKAQTWGNSCEFGFGRVCPMIYQPVDGWKVSVQADQLNWTYHVSKDGTNLLMDRRRVMTARVADAIAQDILQRFGPSIGLNSLRFLEAKEEPKQVCSLFGGCRTVPTWLTIVSNGRQQWGYQSDEQGNRVEPISVAQVRRALEQTASK